VVKKLTLLMQCHKMCPIAAQCRNKLSKLNQGSALQSLTVQFIVIDRWTFIWNNLPSTLCDSSTWILDRDALV